MNDNKELTPEYNLKLLSLGETGVGKTSIISMYAENSFFANQEATIGIDFKTTSLDINEELFKSCFEKLVEIDKLIKTSNGIFIMGHRFIDLDAIAASIAMQEYVKTKNKKSTIIINDIRFEKGVKKVLSAAAFTYVAGFLASALQVLRLVLLSRRRR